MPKLIKNIVDLLNLISPEHLELNVKKPKNI